MQTAARIGRRAPRALHAGALPKGALHTSPMQ